MTTLFTYVRSDETDAPLYGIVATDTGAEYVFPKGVEPWLNLDDRLDFILGRDEDEPDDAQGWLDLASRNLGSQAVLDAPYDDASSPAQAKRMMSGYLDKAAAVSTSSPLMQDAAVAFEQVAADYPGFGDSDESLIENPEALDNMVLMALGPIDPEGPNGWILRAMDGEPREGDEDEWVHFPGTIEPSDDGETEEASE